MEIICWGVSLMKKSHVEIAVCAAIIVAVALLGRWAFSVDTYAQDGIQPTPTPTPTVTPTTLAILAIPEDSPDQGVAYTPTPTATLTHREVIATAVARERQTRVARQNATATAAAAATATAKANPPTATFTATPTDTPTPTGRGPRPIVGPGPTDTPTPTPVQGSNPAPRPLWTLFETQILYEGNKPIQDASRTHWSVLHKEKVTFRITARPNSGVNPANYTFKVHFNSADTGFYEVFGRNIRCAATSFSFKGASSSTTMIRCGQGVPSNTGMMVTAKLTNSSNTPVAI